MGEHRSSRPLRIVAGASTGGHVNELLILMRHAPAFWPKMPDAYVTSLPLGKAGFAEFDKPIHVIGAADRNTPLRALLVLFRALYVAWRLRPDVVVTTGALPLALFCACARLFGARIVWIDSVAQISGLSASGRWVRSFADLFLVQWRDNQDRNGGVEYVGELF